LVSVLFSTLFKDELKALLLKEINKQLKTELVIKGDSEISLFKFFPNASFSFQEISIKDALRPGQNLVEAESLTFLFNIQDAFNSTYNFQELVVENGVIYIYTNKAGKNNYDIFKEEEVKTKKKKKEEKPTSIQLNKAEFKNVRLVYDDAQSNLKTAFQIESANLGSLDYVDTQVLLQIKGVGQLEDYQIEEVSYLSNQALKVDLELDTDYEKGTYGFKESEFSLGENDFSINGLVKTLKQGYDLNLDFKGLKLSLDEFLTLLPESASESVADWKIDGDFDFGAKMKGKYKENYYPNVKADFVFQDGTITPKSLGYPLKKFSCNANFTNGVLNHANTSLFTLQNIDFNLLGNPFHFDGEISNLKKPRIKGQASGRLDLYAFRDYLKKNFGISDLKGEIDFKDWSFNGNWADFKTTQKYPQSQGQVLLDNLAFKYEQGELKRLNGLITSNGKDWFCEGIECKFPNSEATLRGEILNFSPFLLQWSDSLVENPIVPKFGLNLSAKELELSDFQDFRPEQADSLVVAETEEEVDFPQIDGFLDLEIGVIKTDKTSVENVNGSLCISGSSYRIEDLAFDVFEGRGLISGII